jgi:hypothetical protein
MYSFSANSLAGFPPDSEQKIRDLQGIIEYQAEEISKLERLYEMRNFHKLTTTEERAYWLMQKLKDMPHRECKIIKENGNGKCYLDSIECREFFLNEIEERLRYNPDMKNPYKVTLEIMRLIRDTYPDHFKLEPSSNSKKVWVLIYY